MRNPNWVSRFLWWEKKPITRGFAPLRSLNEENFSDPVAYLLITYACLLIPSPDVGRGPG